ncbi:hypothetical protein GUJ93_ZPchr0011g28637 [Zizania palustris]|uniref:Uncharacterized protein n=1 Tax=Zizania palustris TaxID=103762 RepID=A0A8J5WLK1_ZIZPA|nr:hypothetical protein GUJ93_ZPchr0011g28637 [Zizania palustris]
MGRQRRRSGRALGPHGRGGNRQRGGGAGPKSGAGGMEEEAQPRRRRRAEEGLWGNLGVGIGHSRRLVGRGGRGVEEKTHGRWAGSMEIVRR